MKVAAGRWDYAILLEVILTYDLHCRLGVEPGQDGLQQRDPHLAAAAASSVMLLVCHTCT